MKKIKKALLIISILIITIYTLDFVTFFTRAYQYSEYKQTKKIDWKKNIYEQFCPAKYWAKFISVQEHYQYIEFRDALTEKENNKSPILLLGGSFMHGDELSFEESFSYKLSKETNRNVYNRAFSGKDPKFMLFQTQLYYIIKNFYILKQQNKELDISTFIYNLGFDKTTTKNLQKIFNDKKSAKIIYKNFDKIANEKNIEYAFYTFMFDHTRRMQVKAFTPITVYSEVFYKKENNNNLVLQDTFASKYRILSLPAFFEEQYVDYICKHKEKETLELLGLYIRKTKELLEKNNPNIKFIVIYYQINDNYAHNDIKNLLKNDKNIILVNIKDYVSEEVMFSNPQSNHPPSIVWKKAIPQIAKQFNL